MPYTREYFTCEHNQMSSVSGTRRSDHITPVLRQLHWLPVRQGTEFKMAVLMYKALNGLSPQYLADDCQLITTTGRRRLRSSKCCYLRRSTNPQNFGRSILHCCWSTSVTLNYRFLPVTENAFAWLKIAAPSDLHLDVCAL